jgi:hypothetical protein
MRGLLAPGNAVSATALAQRVGENGLSVDAFLTRLPATLVVAVAPRRPDGGVPPLATVDAGAPLPLPAADAGTTAGAPDALFGL